MTKCFHSAQCFQGSTMPWMYETQFLFSSRVSSHCRDILCFIYAFNSWWKCKLFPFKFFPFTLFIWEPERGTEMKSWYPPVHSQMSTTVRAVLRPKPRGRNAIQVCRVGGEDAVLWDITSVSESAAEGSCSQTRRSDMERRRLNYWATHRLPFLTTMNNASTNAVCVNMRFQFFRI